MAPMDINPLNQALLGAGLGGFTSVLVVALLVWSIVWKGIALWRAARNDQKAWFIVLLIANSAGILDIVYLLFFTSDQGNVSMRRKAPEMTATTIVEEVVVDE